MPISFQDIHCLRSKQYDVSWAPLRARFCFLVSPSVVLASYVFVSSLSFLLSSFSLGLLFPFLHTRLSIPCLHLPFRNPLCSGDSPEQRSAAAWQRASPVLSLSGDHQWDLHPCACAKLAGGLPQSHTRHYGVCVASPVTFTCPVIPLSVCPVFVSVMPYVPFYTVLSCVFLSISIADVSRVKGRRLIFYVPSFLLSKYSG